MSRNANGRFSQLPKVKVSRSRFDRSSSIKTTFNVGQLIPFYVDEVLPGDTFSIDTSKVVRLQTPIAPIMDNIYLDTYYFFVPNRLVWEHWVNLMGENTESAWIPETTYTVPQVTSPPAVGGMSAGWRVGTIADYMGIPIGVGGLSVNALPFRAYALIVNDWFRDENLQDPVNIPTGDATVVGVNSGLDAPGQYTSYIQDLAKGGQPFICAKFHDYFTSALPSPQKGPDVELPIFAGESGYIPVLTTTADNQFPNSNLPPMRMHMGNTVPSYPSGQYSQLYVNGVDAATTKLAGFSQPGAYSGVIAGNPYPTNLVADTTPLLADATINQLRLAFQTQKYFEKLARGGSRYIESINVHFGVTNPDYRLQRPEYLGGNRVPITINQVVQQSATTEDSPQGNVAAQSLTTDRHSDFTKSFTEHGFVIGLMVARYHHTYQQGLNKMWSRRSVLDYYFPVFANLGEMPIYNREIYAQGTSVDDEVFGYQEAWADYRYRPSICTGEMRSTYAQSLDVWHLGDNYESLPKLSSGWIHEDMANVNRVLAVQSSVSAQFLADVYVKCYATRPMPVYSVPGLIDHH